MRSTNNDPSYQWNGWKFSFFLQWILFFGHNIYIIWFYINEFLVETMQQYISPAAGAIYGMFLLEGHTMCRAAWYRWKKYHRNPEAYGLNQWTETNCRHRPVLLLPGAVGSWSYLGDLAVALKNANIPVFVIDLGVGSPTEEMRKKVVNKLEEIRRLYSDFHNQTAEKSPVEPLDQQSLFTIEEETSTLNLINPNDQNETIKTTTTTTTTTTNSKTIPLVDIVAHSNGGNIALYSAFSEDCSYIDEQGYLQFRSELQANPYIGKLITVALPSNQTETNWICEINKLNDLFNINAKYDALMGYKKCALIEQLRSHVNHINAGHIGIVFQPATHHRILQFLRR